MKPRVSASLKDYGCTATVEEFRAALITVKADHFAEWDLEELTYTRHQAEDFCKLVRQRLESPKLPRTFILRNLINCRKNGLLRGHAVSAGASASAVASSIDGRTE